MHTHTRCLPLLLFLTHTYTHTHTHTHTHTYTYTGPPGSIVQLTLKALSDKTQYDVFLMRAKSISLQGISTPHRSALCNAQPTGEVHDTLRVWPRTEEIGLEIITTAKISNKFSRESPYISNTFSRETPKFQTASQVHISARWEVVEFRWDAQNTQRIPC